MSDALPYPPDTGRTHWDGCWRERGHHNCAVTRVAELEAENKKLDALWRSLACSHCLDNHDRVVQLEAERDALRAALKRVSDLLKPISVEMGRDTAYWLSFLLDDIDAALRSGQEGGE